jgi:hypothetical protein
LAQPKLDPFDGKVEHRMTLFEYLAIAFSLVFSFSAMRLIGGLPHALAADRRYWVHLTLVLGQLFATVGVFWVFWSYRDVEWSLPRFLLALGSPALIYFNACALIPEVPASVDSWHDYYLSVRQRYFAGMVVWAFVVMAASTVILDMPWAHPARGSQVVFLAIGVIGLAFSDPRVHAGIAAAFLCGIPIFAFVLGSHPAPLLQ